jgi:hypothetical protein
VLSHAGTQLKGTYLAHERGRISREDVYADMYRQCGRGVAGFADTPGLDVLLAPAWSDADRQTEGTLLDILRHRFDPADGTSEPFIRRLSGCVMDFLLREQAVLRTAGAAQCHINRLLGRDPPRRAVNAADINVHNLMQGVDPGRLPYLIDELERLLGIQIDLDMNRLAIARRDEAA